MPLINDDEKLTVEQYRAYMDAVRRCLELEFNWRQGQTMFNVLWELHPTLAAVIRGSEFDPFYRDARIPAFLKELLSTAALSEVNPLLLLELE